MVYVFWSIKPVLELFTVFCYQDCWEMSECCSIEVLTKVDMHCMWHICHGCFVFRVGVVPQTSQSSSIVTTPNDTPRTATTIPLSTIQPSVMLAGRQASSCNELSRQTADGSTAGGHCSTDCQTAPDQKQTPRLLPADNFGLLIKCVIVTCQCYFMAFCELQLELRQLLAVDDIITMLLHNRVILNGDFLRW